MPEPGVPEARLAEIEAIEFPNTGLWVVGDERVTTQDIVTGLIAEVRRLRGLKAPTMAQMMERVGKYQREVEYYRANAQYQNGQIRW